MRSSTLRLDPRFVSLAAYSGILFFNVYVLFLFLEGQLTLYIHPRYVLFTAVLNAICMLACGTGFVLAAWRVANDRTVVRASWRPSLTLVVAGLVLVAAYALPARTLSSDAADQRSGNFNAVRVTPSSAASSDATLALFGADTGRLTIEDWVSSFGLKASPEFYVDKEVDLVGFVYSPRDAPESVFYVARFRVTCCAVDAQPLGVPVHAPSWRERLEEDSWVRVTGSFSEKGDLDIAEPAVVAPRGIQPTDQPRDPYIVD